MARRQDLSDGTGVLLRQPNVGVLYIVREVNPAGTETGYATGCLWNNAAGTVGGILYVNVGTNANASWMAIA